MTNLWGVAELTADPLKPIQPMEASGMKAPTPDRHCISTQPSLHTLLPYREITKLLHSLLLSWEPALVSSLYGGGAESPRGEELCCSAAHTPREEGSSYSPQAVSPFPASLHSHLHLQILWPEWNAFPCNNANTVVCISGRSCKRALGHRGRRIKTFHPIRSCEVPRADHW